MAILVEGISVIVKASEIHEKVTGRWEGFKNIVPNKTLCCDNEIARVGFMVPDDVKHFIEKLEFYGLISQGADGAQDIAVADQLHGVSAKCDWLEFGHINLNNDPEKKIVACRLSGSTEDQIFMPENWKFENSLSSSYGFSPAESQSKGLIFLRHEDGIDVYISEVTGEEVYVGRTGQP